MGEEAILSIVRTQPLILTSGHGIPVHLGPLSLYLLEVLWGGFLCVNVVLVIWAIWGRGGERASGGDTRKSSVASVALGLASGSQILYFAMIAVGLLRWVRFYPGNPAVLLLIVGGLALSAAGFFVSLFGAGIRRWAAMFMSLTMTFIWLFAAATSVAV